MAYEIRENSGSMFANDRAGENPNAPQAKGKALIGGVMYWVSAWTKTKNDGGKWQSLSFEPMNAEHTAQYGPQAQSQGYQQPAQGGAVQGGGGAAQDFSDDIPF